MPTESSAGTGTGINWTKLLIWLAIIIFVIPVALTLAFVAIPFVAVAIGSVVLLGHM